MQALITFYRMKKIIPKLSLLTFMANGVKYGNADQYLGVNLEYLTNDQSAFSRMLPIYAVSEQY